MAVLQTTLTVVMRQFAKDTVWKLLTCNLNLKDEIGDLSNTVEGLDDNIQDNSAKIEETENLAQNLVDLNDTISAKIHEAETLVQNLDNTLNDLSLNTTSTVDLERLELAENNIIHLNNSLETLVEDLEGISLCWQKNSYLVFMLFSLCREILPFVRI